MQCFCHFCHYIYFFFFVLINDKQNIFQVNYYSGLSYLDRPKVKGQKEENSDKTGNKAVAEPVTEQVGNNSTHSEKQVEKGGQWVPRKEKSQSIYEIMRQEKKLQSLLTVQHNVAQCSCFIYNGILVCSGCYFSVGACLHYQSNLIMVFSEAKLQFKAKR